MAYSLIRVLNGPGFTLPTRYGGLTIPAGYRMVVEGDDVDVTAALGGASGLSGVVKVEDAPDALARFVGSIQLDIQAGHVSVIDDTGAPVDTGAGGSGGTLDDTGIPGPHDDDIERFVTASALAQATDNITLTLQASGGDDEPTADRPPVLVNDDYSASPFATFVAAFNAIPANSKRTVLNVAGGAYSGSILTGKHGQEIIVKGALPTATIQTGSTSGTAGAGTTGTALKKPTAAANWTVDDLRSRRVLVKLTGGGGYDAAGDVYGKNLLPVLDNTTDTIVLPPENGAIDSSTTFTLVTGSVIVSGSADRNMPFTGDQLIMGVLNCFAEVHFVGIQFEVGETDFNVFTRNNNNVHFRGCVFKGGVSFFDKGSAISVNACYLYNEALMCATVDRFECMHTVANSASLWTNKTNVVNMLVDIDVDNGSNNALVIERALSAEVNATLANCDSGTPYMLKSVLQSESIITGANAGTARGMEIMKGGQHIVTGSDVAGSWTNELLIEGKPISWAALAGQGAAMDRGTFVHWGFGGLEILNTFTITPVVSDIANGTLTLSEDPPLIVNGDGTKPWE